MTDRSGELAVVRRAGLGDLLAIGSVLGECGLSSVGLEEGGLYWIAYHGPEIAGVVGIEASGQAGLLRSLAVHPSFRNAGLARRLVSQLLSEIRQLGVDHVYLFSKDSGAFFERLGWSETSVKAAAQRLSRTSQVQHYERVGWYKNERAFVRSADSLDHRAL